ncbi:phospholipase A1 isoform X1 [Osmia bicornis bicornis]|uniref:phospholipase A1 isoform X1 n=1 Tax=Osmia bicornis bicornis TaxID=1437191 RepID=UPI001EAF2507|nr:phospholipase A1 isoform X1 [Osmia bicornis bicornis]
MILFVLLFIKLSLLSTVHSQVLKKSADISFNYTDENSLISNSYNLSNFLFTPVEFPTRAGADFEPHQVDCLGLGKTVATTLEWFFMSKPNGSNALNVQFLLSSRKQPNPVEVIIGKQFGLEWTDFQIVRKTVIIVHGFLSHGQEPWISSMAKSFLQWGDVNVVVVDWSSGSNTWNYYKAAVNTEVVGYQISRFLEHIENATSTESNWGPLHLVGHSLGAHICGFAAKELKKRQSKWKIERITGLDPAQPCFKNADSTVKLHKSDAPFVDIIHTNGRLLSEIGLGLPQPIGWLYFSVILTFLFNYYKSKFSSGHVDFYPNGGRRQPGCGNMNSSYFEYLPIPIADIKSSICSHGRSYIYLTESLMSDVKKNCTFWAHYWDLSFRSLKQLVRESCNRNVCTEMGINAINYSQRGTFFVATSDSVPFCNNNTRITDTIIMMGSDHVDLLDD